VGTRAARTLGSPLVVMALVAALLVPVGENVVAAPAGAATPVAPCGKGNATGATDTGVTNKSITIATIQDIGGPRPGLFTNEQKAMEGFVAYCNSLGGINGRTLNLVKYDSALLDAFAQYQKACDQFAIVGEVLIFDDVGVKPTTACGIPSVAGISQPTRTRSDNVFNPSPNPGDKVALGRYQWLKKQFPGVQKSAAMLYANTATTQNSGDKQIAGMEQLGYNFAYKGVTEINVVNWGPFVNQLRQHQTTYLTQVADIVNWAGLQREMVAQGVKVKVTDATSTVYTPAYIQQAGSAAEGTLIGLTTAAFEDAKKLPELQNYLKWVKKMGGTPTSVGVEVWSAGLLFATAMQSLGSNVTRKGLMTALKGIHQWDGNGIQGVADPGAKQPTGCFLYLQVKNGKFVRLYPKQGFACSKAIATVPSAP
jgi:ABC-type branched-subunit amino acid transport system substrate-binding protein